MSIAGRGLRFLALIVALLGAAVSHAQAPWASGNIPTVVSTGSGSAQIRPGTSRDLADLLSKPSRVYGSGGPSATNPSNGIIKDLLAKPFNPIPGGVAIERQVAAKAVGKALARAIPIVGTGLLISDAIDMIESTGCKLNLNEAKIECPGDYVPVQEFDTWYRVVDQPGPIMWYQSADAAARMYEAYLNSTTNTATRRSKYVVALGTVPTVDGPFAISWTETSVQVYVYHNPSSAFRWEARPDVGPVARTAYRKTGMEWGQQCEFELQPDGSCVMNPSPDDFGDKVPQNEETGERMPRLMDWMDKNDIGYETGNPRVVDLPSVVDGGRVGETQNPNGSTTTTDRRYRFTTPASSPDPLPKIEWRNEDTTITWPPGTPPVPYEPVDVPPTEHPPGTVVTTTTATPPDVFGCGLPNTPPCKIDETGTPVPPEDKAEADVESVFRGLFDCISDPASCVPELPDINWSFSLPSYCGPIPTPAFAPVMATVDICGFQDVFHDLMSMLWVLAGIVGAVRLFTADAVGSE